MSTIYTILGALPTIVTALITILAVIAPLTSSDYDNKVLDALRWFEDKVLSILLPALARKAPAAPAAK